MSPAEDQIEETDPATAARSLSPASAALADAEPLLPALRLMLDDQALSDWLCEHSGRDVHLRRRYLRLKPGTSVVLAAEVSTLDGPQQLLVAGYSPQAAPKLDKSLEKAPPWSILAVDRHRRMVATALSADRDLPALAATADAGGRARVLGGTLDTPLDPAAVDLTPLSYKPNRRWVGTVDTPDCRVLMRAYRPHDLAPVLRAVVALANAHAPVPRVLGGHRRLGLALLEHLPGELPDHGSAADLAAAGRTLAQLHRSPAALSPVSTTAVQGRTRDTIDQVARLLPDEAGRARALDDDVRNRLAGHPRRPDDAVALHGDFSLDQVICRDGAARLIDLDRAGSGPAARDLGGLLADELAGAAGGLSGRAREILDAVLTGYAEVLDVPDEAALVDHALDRLLDRAAEPFRHAHPDWADRTSSLLGAAESLLLEGLPDSPGSPR